VPEEIDVPTQVRERIQAGGTLTGVQRVVAMLSGGQDSVCLLDLLTGICGKQSVHAIHVNYGLRPQAGDDEAHCLALCEQLGVTLEVHRARKSTDTGNTQAWARDVRYRAAAELAERLATTDADEVRIATGHTASDQAETILYRLAASPGRRALLGMPDRDGRLIRPLLSITREQTAAYCRARGLSWREDASNTDESFARARVRGGLLPALCAVHPAALENVLRTAQLLREETDLLNALVEEQLEGESSIAIERLEQMPAALARLVVVRLAEQAAGTFVPQAGERVGEILALASRRAHGQLHIGGLVAAVVESGRLRMVAIAAHYTAPDRD
jgi:tRNA(Ile)-lysidine synthase